MHRISPIPLTVQAFADFGDVVEASPGKMFSINKGTTNRFHDLASINVKRDGGRPVVNIFSVTPLPFSIDHQNDGKSSSRIPVFYAALPL